MKVFAVAMDLLREAASRKWILALGAGISLILLVLGLSLELEVVDGALAATRLFGDVVSNDVRAADVVLRSVFQAVSYVIFYGGILFGVLACADFAPSLLSPGRIEHMLALPVRRWELLLGTFLGVLALSSIGAIYAAGGFTVMLGVKTGVWTVRPVLAALLGTVTFAALYAAMLTSALFIRSAAVSALAGLLLFVIGIIASYRDKIAPVIEAGFQRVAFEKLTLLFPRVASLADASGAIAASQPVDARLLTSMSIGMLVFGASALAVGAWRFDAKDF